ncbi:MAG: class I SAM-dependent methyltransferase [Nanoarchaeota archaeon]|nr:class I SAM-dependent methyltransferase [Nanoarchaeota archaeon]
MSMVKRRWKVKIERPEEVYGDLSLYYTEEEIERYARSGGMKRAQERIAHRILELLELKKGSKLLDLGCGVGFTTKVYQEEGYEVIGLDILPKMLEKAKEKGLKVKEGDMRELSKLFEREEFDAVVSASALQWMKKREDLEKLAFGIRYVLKRGGKLVIQFYPKSEEELWKVARIFKGQGFEGEVVIDNPDSPRKRRIYLSMKAK